MAGQEHEMNAMAKNAAINKTRSEIGARMAGVKQSATAFWNQRNKRERTMLSVAFAVIALGLFYFLLIDPALSGRQDLEKKLPALRQQAAEVQAMARQAGTQTSRAARPVPALTRESLETSLSGKGLKAQNVGVTGELAKVQLNGVSFAGVIDWLADVQRSARLSVVDANIEAQGKPDSVNAALTLRQQRSEQAQ
jgi:general secretion pathway protein M